jgi:hypothetical protein
MELPGRVIAKAFTIKPTIGKRRRRLSWRVRVKVVVS